MPVDCYMCANQARVFFTQGDGLIACCDTHTLSRSLIPRFPQISEAAYRFRVSWIEVVTLARSFHVEEHGKELWLVKHDGPVVDGLCENGKNIPFRPHILCAKSDSKNAVAVFGEASELWRVR